MTELKKCPFCGGEASVIESYDCMAGIYIYFVECCNCTATFYKGDIDKIKAIEAWNRRVNDERN